MLPARMNSRREQILMGRVGPLFAQINMMQRPLLRLISIAITFVRLARLLSWQGMQPSSTMAKFLRSKQLMRVRTTCFLARI
jgi:hypothetical protein